jgi:hypothetical protein
VADMLKAGVEYLIDQIKAQAGRSVTYRRGAASVTLTVTLGKKRLMLGDDVGGLRIQHSDRDYLIAAADLVLSGSLTTPAKGDTILDDNEPDGTARVWEVLSPGGDEAPWQWSDPYQQLLRCHTKWVDTE